MRQLLRPLVLFTALAGSASAQMYADFATISPTAPLQASRLCYNDGRDLVCDARAPFLANNGNVGIGTSGPGGYTLSISSSAMPYTNVGIGIGSKGDTALEIGEASAGNHYAFIDLTGDATYTDYGLRIIRNNDGPNAANLIQVRGTGGLHLQTQDVAPILLYTNNTERMRIASNGNIGIGTSTPSQTLDVVGNSRVNGLFYINGSTEGAGALIQDANINWNFANLELRRQSSNTSQGRMISFMLGGDSMGDTIDNNYFKIVLDHDAALTKTTASTSATALRFNGPGNISFMQAGNFSIGTSTPNAKLEVNGTISATNLILSGGCIGCGGAGSGDRIVSGTASVIARQTSNTVSVSGTLELANSGSEPCDAAHYKMLRMNPATGRLQVCQAP